MSKSPLVIAASEGFKDSFRLVFAMAGALLSVLSSFAHHGPQSSSAPAGKQQDSKWQHG